MKLFTSLLTLSLFVVSMEAQAFKGSSISANFQYDATGQNCQVTVPNTYTITDANANGITNHRALGVELCRNLGLMPLTASGATAGSGFVTYSGDVSTTNCAYRTSGVANGSWTCQSSASYANAQ